MEINKIYQGNSIDVLYAYLAGIVDGEGYIGIKRSTWGMRNRNDIKNPVYSERIQIKMNDKSVLDIFKNTFGGSLITDKRIYLSKSGFKTNKVMHCYGATDKVAVNIITKLLPYLIIKRKQAELVLLLRDSKNSPDAKLRGGMSQKRTMKQSVLEYRENLYKQIKTIHGH